jgi:hypothetical protein
MLQASYYWGFALMVRQTEVLLKHAVTGQSLKSCQESLL